jgi:hypothetical protein
MLQTRKYVVSDSKNPAPDPIGALFSVWQAPMTLYFDWWKTAFQSLDHSCSPDRPAGSDEDEGQLVVPDPIETEGEHALFA